MMMVIGILLALGAGVWFGRRLGPALVAAVMVMGAPLWLIGGFILDLLRKLPIGLRRAWFALLRAFGFLVVLPLTPFVFVWAFLAELFKPKHQPPAPIQSATQRTAEVIDLAAWRRRKLGVKE
ncbi:hypothetical protein AX279_00485 [Pseudomonas sp. J237]|nr:MULTISPECIES: hypothetical protein [Pseudomonas]OEO27818.1 hypothetical protein AX279_00485 [Pseudomonas sp. J237]